MRQDDDARDARGHPLQYREFETFPEPPLASQWRVLDRLETAIAQMNRKAEPPSREANLYVLFREGQDKATSMTAPASRAPRPWNLDLHAAAPARPSLFRRYTQEAGAQLRLSDLFRRATQNS